MPFTNLMRKDVKEKFPSWIEEGKEYQLCMSDDIDSWLSCCVLESVTGHEVNYFYSFDEFYVMDSEGQKEAIGVDIALMKGKCWDNHVTMLSRRDSVNEQSANLNAVFKISRDNYTEKWAGSTLLLVWSYYDLPLPESEEGKMLLLTIDSTYKGHYMSKFKETQNAYLRMLDMEELIEVQEQHSQRDFQKISTKYRIKEKIKVNDGNLETELMLEEIGEILGFDLSLPQWKFKLMKKFENVVIDLNKKRMRYKLGIKDDVFSLALTSQLKLKYSSM
ncbi:hypothetical protein MTP04_34400 [Lysinibacillus sp. PLM2]|nr:hypothetical protein MTP04_34400 [Lysinibacillus sp. PLM2]